MVAHCCIKFKRLLVFFTCHSSTGTAETLQNFAERQNTRTDFAQQKCDLTLLYIYFRISNRLGRREVFVAPTQWDTVSSP